MHFLHSSARVGELPLKLLLLLLSLFVVIPLTNQLPGPTTRRSTVWAPALHYLSGKNNCTVLLYMHILSFHFWKWCWIYFFSVPSTPGLLCSFVISWTVYHNIHCNHNMNYTRTHVIATKNRTQNCMCSCVHVLGLSYVHIGMICPSGQNMSIINVTAQRWIFIYPIRRCCCTYKWEQRQSRRQWAKTEELEDKAKKKITKSYHLCLDSICALIIEPIYERQSYRPAYRRPWS